jgi:hypothetical protein
MNDSSNLNDLTLLCDEIREGILNLGGDTIGQRKNLEQEIDAYSEVVYPLLLFRKFSEIAHGIKDANSSRSVSSNSSSSGSSSSSSSRPSSARGEGNSSMQLPSFLTETKASHLTGWAVLGQHIFWLRVSCSLFAFLSFVIMGCVSSINSTQYKPATDFAVRTCRACRFTSLIFCYLIAVLCCVFVH